MSFIENQQHIESDWDNVFGDRKNEIVFIGQKMNKELIISHLDSCLSTDEELESNKWIEGYEDDWPVEKVYAI